ncbi:hypothetical protein E2C01_098512 [Portunus trituberculatus]|uniref:Uncharacterized protein n=1 Tax=Portunus trituberculatus TaxID=210409 RepID=A0A5B7K359_PORTR|nr:hypothetical protein [Portunus trituberculatus]
MAGARETREAESRAPRLPRTHPTSPLLHHPPVAPHLRRPPRPNTHTGHPPPPPAAHALVTLQSLLWPKIRAAAPPGRPVWPYGRSDPCFPRPVGRAPPRRHTRRSPRAAGTHMVHRRPLWAEGRRPAAFGAC